MRLFVYESSRGAWESVSGLMGGLKSAAESSRDALLLSESPAEELADVLAAACFFKLAGGRDNRLAVASPCPSPVWIERVRAAGIERVFAVPYPRHLTPKSPLADSIEIPLVICPSLHVRAHGELSLCVCGERADLMVLATHHFAKRCFADWPACKFRKPKAECA